MDKSWRPWLARHGIRLVLTLPLLRFCSPNAICKVHNALQTFLPLALPAPYATNDAFFELKLRECWERFSKEWRQAVLRVAGSLGWVSTASRLQPSRERWPKGRECWRIFLFSKKKLLNLLKLGTEVETANSVCLCVFVGKIEMCFGVNVNFWIRQLESVGAKISPSALLAANGVEDILDGGSGVRERDWHLETQLPRDLESNLQALADTAHPQLSLSEGIVLLTGASGFLGCHILAALLRETSAHVVCIVRGESPDIRLRENIAKLELEGHIEDWSRVEVVFGDVSEEMFGMGEGGWAALLSRPFRAIIHNAAHVNHSLPYPNLKSPNVQSTLELLRFVGAKFCLERVVVPLVFVSTNAVDILAASGRTAALTTPPLLPPSAVSGYVQSK